MELRLDRWPSSSGVTFGSLRFRREVGRPWEWLCYTQEAGTARRDSLYVPGESTVPSGRWNVSLVSPLRFPTVQFVPLLRCVGTSDGSRPMVATYFHPGHHIADATGCIEVGLAHDGPRVRKTKAAFDALLALLPIPTQRDGVAVDLEIA